MDLALELCTERLFEIAQRKKARRLSVRWVYSAFAIYFISVNRLRKRRMISWSRSMTAATSYMVTETEYMYTCIPGPFLAFTLTIISALDRLTSYTIRTQYQDQQRRRLIRFGLESTGGLSVFWAGLISSASRPVFRYMDRSVVSWGGLISPASQCVFSCDVLNLSISSSLTTEIWSAVSTRSCVQPDSGLWRCMNMKKARKMYSASCLDIESNDKRSGGSRVYTYDSECEVAEFITTFTSSAEAAEVSIILSASMRRSQYGAKRSSVLIFTRMMEIVRQGPILDSMILPESLPWGFC